MPRFFVSDSDINEETVTIRGDDAHHISHSLRMRAGEHLTVCDGNGNDYSCTISGFTKSEVTLEINGKAPVSSEPECRVTVFQAIARGDKNDTVVQKSVEYGAYRIVPFSSSRCNVSLGDDGNKKTARRRRISEEAAKQCGRGIIPEVTDAVAFDDAVSEAASADLALFCYENGTVPLKAVIKEKKPASVSVMVGPEGGFSPEEAEKAEKYGLIPVSLGKRILRTESAAPFALACIFYEFEG